MFPWLHSAFGFGSASWWLWVSCHLYFLLPATSSVTMATGTKERLVFETPGCAHWVSSVSKVGTDTFAVLKLINKISQILLELFICEGSFFSDEDVHCVLVQTNHDISISNPAYDINLFAYFSLLSLSKI